MLYAYFILWWGFWSFWKVGEGGGGGGGVVRSEHQVNIGSMIGYLLGIELVFQNKIIRV